MLIAMFVTTAMGIVGVYAAKELSRYSYARGMYDSCIVISVYLFGQPPAFATRDCMMSIAKAMASGNFYEMPSPGFEWPLQPTLNEEQQ